MNVKYKPFIRVRCGVKTHFHEDTAAHTKASAGPEWLWDKKMDNHMTLHRTPKDDNKLCVQAYDHHPIRHTFLGGGQIDLQKYTDAPNEEMEKTVVLYESGINAKGTGTGSVTMKIKWIPQQHEEHSLSERMFNLQEMVEEEFESALEHTNETETRESEQKRNKKWKAPVGELHVTVLRANDLRSSADIIRDLSTFVDVSAIYVALGLILGFLLFSFLFYWWFLGSSFANLEQGGELQALVDQLHGGNGEWDEMNTMVFLVTTFTTVGYGNHPSLMHEKPPCSYPSLDLTFDDPGSILLPEIARRGHSCPGCSDAVSAIETPVPFGTGAGQGIALNEFNIAMCDEGVFDFCTNGTQLDPTKISYEELCLKHDYSYVNTDPRCWIIADKSGIFRFGTLTEYRIYPESENVNEMIHSAEQLAHLEIPGSLRDHSTFSEMNENGYHGYRTDPLSLPPCCGLHTSCSEQLHGVEFRNSTALLDWKQLCFTEFKESCDEQLRLWRVDEYQKMWGKVFTVVFIFLGIAVLGNALGTIGQQIINFFKRCFKTVDAVIDTATFQKAEGAGDYKGAMVALVALIPVLLLGALMYGTFEDLKFLDALYFAVVTAATVGFGDYVPTSAQGKGFTLLFVPFSVSIMAATIQRVAHIPIKRRARFCNASVSLLIKVEDYVLSQFGAHLTPGDFADIRRSVNLGPSDSVSANDFLLAMLIRLGHVSTRDMVKVRRLFNKLDRFVLSVSLFISYILLILRMLIARITRDGSGVLDEDDISEILLVRPATHNIDDKNFNVHDRETHAFETDKIEPQSARSVRLTNPLASTSE